MGEQRTGIPLAEGLSCTLDATKEHPERYATILGGEKPLPLSKVQALALFRVMLSHLHWPLAEADTYGHAPARRFIHCRI